MDAGEIGTLFEALYADIVQEDQYPNKRPLLAHYTSMDAMENILKSNEVWFSNPLFMNDHEEVIFGIVNGSTRIKHNEHIRSALGSDARYRIFSDLLDQYISDFGEKYLLDTYVFCLSEHDLDNRDGMLSMWRGYGGNGKGAALVFDMGKVTPLDDTPIVILRVNYGSLEERFVWMDRIAASFAKVVEENDIPDDMIYVASHALFHRIKLFALATKHKGFKEEREWRAVYMSDHDDEGKLRPMQHYVNGYRGVEPKLKLELKPIEGVTPCDFFADDILASILLGPSTSSALAVRSVERMLELIKRSELKDRLIASSIPLRAI